MVKNYGTWLVLFIAFAILTTIGIEGAVGKVIAVAFAPDIITVVD